MKTNKIAIISDTHFGVKNGNELMLNYQLDFFEHQFFPYLVENQINKIIHMGDFFDQRKVLNYKVMQAVQKRFLASLFEYDIHMDIIYGNHDTYWKHTNNLNSVDLVLGTDDYSEHINIIKEPMVKKYGPLDIAFLPWICLENEEASFEFIEKTTAPFLVGHLDVIGFDMIKGGIAKSTHGLRRDNFKKFESVLTGHYHTKSSIDNIHYLGTQYELTWADSNDPKHFHILDTTTREVEAIRNPVTLFNKIKYDGDNPPEIDKDLLRDTYIKVIIINKGDLYEFDKWLDRLNKCEPFEVKIAEAHDNFLGENVDDEKIDSLDTSSILKSYIDNVDTELDKEKLNSYMQGLLIEAQNIGL